LEKWPRREEAWELLIEHTEGASLRRHALAVEAAMRAYALKEGADPEIWGVAGLLHDFDYEKHPDPQEHPYFGVSLLRQRGYPEELSAAILSHAPHTGRPRVTPLEKTLYAVDELCGFLTACALVQPGKRLADVRIASVRKKLKDKAFARGVHREHILEGAAELGVDLDEHIAFVLSSLVGIDKSLDLA
jgi:putative nucleotidyltransferase with HDIG domain